MRLKPVVVEVIVAVVIVAIVLIVSPGLAVTGILALLFLAVCGITLLIDSRQSRRGGVRRPRRGRRPVPPATRRPRPR